MLTPEDAYLAGGAFDPYERASEYAALHLVDLAHRHGSGQEVTVVDPPPQFGMILKALGWDAGLALAVSGATS